MTNTTNITTCNILTSEIFEQCLKMKKNRQGIEKTINKISQQTVLPNEIIKQELIDRGFLFIDDKKRLKMVNTNINYIESKDKNKQYLLVLKEAIRYKRTKKSTLHAIVQISKKENLEDTNVISLLLKNNIIKQHKESVRWSEYFNSLLRNKITNETGA